MTANNPWYRVPSYSALIYQIYWWLCENSCIEESLVGPKCLMHVLQLYRNSSTRAEILFMSLRLQENLDVAIDHDTFESSFIKVVVDTLDPTGRRLRTSLVTFWTSNITCGCVNPSTIECIWCQFHSIINVLLDKTWD